MIRSSRPVRTGRGSGLMQGGMTMDNRRAWLGVAIVGFVLTTALATAAGALAPGAAPGTTLVRVAHLSPDTAGVDVYVDGERALGNVNFETVSNYQTIPAGRHKL